jgi:hypothetical protein
LQQHRQLSTRRNKLLVISQGKPNYPVLGQNFYPVHTAKHIAN